MLQYKALNVQFIALHEGVVELRFHWYAWLFYFFMECTFHVLICLCQCEELTLFLCEQQKEISAVQEKTGVDLEDALLALDEAEKNKQQAEEYVNWLVLRKLLYPKYFHGYIEPYTWVYLLRWSLLYRILVSQSADVEMW